MVVPATLALTALCGLVAAWCVRDLLAGRRAPLLAPCTVQPADGSLLSVLIPARDEAARIGACLEGLASQSYRHFELIVVDDHSCDGTADVVRSYAGRVPALRVLASAPLPLGWAGKCWACWQAAAQASGAWLLFLDADVAPLPGLLAAIVERAERQPLDLLTLMPLLRLGALAERLVLPAFMSLLYGIYPLDRVSDPRSPIAFANGQCMLVRRSTYIALDGHRAVRASILEDTDFGQRLKSAGYRLVAAAAPDLIEVRMYTGWRSLSEGLGKNAVAGYRSGGARSAWVGARQMLIAFLPWQLVLAGLLLAGAQSSAPAATLILLHGALLAALTLACFGWLIQRRFRIAPLWGLVYPLGLAIYFGLSARALVRIRRGRGVVWKGRTFS
jgi:glycosyltransferase involved in cell wall biosynthesis